MSILYTKQDAETQHPKNMLTTQYTVECQLYL